MDNQRCSCFPHPPRWENKKALNEEFPQNFLLPSFFTTYSMTTRPPFQSFQNMDLLALAAVNLLTAVVLYFFFSLRLSRGIQKSRQDPLSPELKENIELAVQYINSSINLLDQKKKSCYNMLRQAEKILSGLGDKAQFPPTESEYARDPQKKKNALSKKGRSKKMDTIEKKTENFDRTFAKTAVEKAATESALAEHALASLGQDTAEITPFSSNAKKAHLLGASKEYHKEKSSLSRADIPTDTRSISFLQTLSQILQQYIQSWSKRNLPKAIAPTSQPPPIPALSQEYLPNSRPVQPTHPTQIEEPLLSFSETLKEPQTFSGRTQLARRLLDQGRIPKDVSSLSGLSLAEVHLLSSLPKSNPNPRRKRLSRPA